MINPFKNIPPIGVWNDSPAGFASGGTNLTILLYKYIVIDKVCFFQFRLDAEAGGGTDATPVTVYLPVYSRAYNVEMVLGHGSFCSSSTTYRICDAFLVDATQNRMQFRTWLGTAVNTTGALSTINGTDMTSTNGFVRVCGFYEINTGTVTTV